MFEAIRQDYQRDHGQPGTPVHWLGQALIHRGFRAVLLYRMGHWYRRHGLRWLAAWHDRWIQRSCHCCISTGAMIGPGFKVAHSVGLVIGAGCIIGRDCDLRQNTTLGGNYNKHDDQGRTKPTLGNNVSVGAGAVILGPVQVGDHCIIGANAVVTRDIPANSIAAGIPARVIKQRWDDDSKRCLTQKGTTPS